MRSFTLYNAFLPGPLEGGATAMMDMRPEDVASLRADLMSPAITARSFAGLYKATMLFRFPADMADLAADALARVDYHLTSDDEYLISHLIGIASSAAISRNSMLAEALFVLLRVHRRFHPDELTVENAFRIAMTACACYSDLADWCKCVGERLNELAFQTNSVETAEHLLSHLTHLCGIVPELWASCGQAEAALRSVKQ